MFCCYFHIFREWDFPSHNIRD